MKIKYDEIKEYDGKEAEKLLVDFPKDYKPDYERGETFDDENPQG